LDIPAPQPPSAEGAWVDDSQHSPPAVTRAVARPQPYVPYYRPVANVYGDPSMASPVPPGGLIPSGPGYAPGYGQGAPPDTGGDAPAPAEDGNNCDSEGTPGNTSFEGRIIGALTQPIDTDLWNQVHSHRRIYGSVDTLIWWTRGNPLPPLVTTSTTDPFSTPQGVAGVLGQATTQILFGNQQVDTFAHSGARLNLGYWLVDGEFWGVEGHYLGLGTAGTDFQRSDNFSNTSLTNQEILARPFFNTQTGLQDSAIVAFPNYTLNFQGGTFLVNLDGSVHVRTSNNVQSAGAGLRHLLWIDFTSQWRLDLVGGYRLFRADDSVTISDSFVTAGGPLAPTTFASSDHFGASNVFNGGEIGVSSQYRLAQRLSMSATGKIALGDVHERVTITGANSISTLGSTLTSSGGLLTQPSNIGTYTRDRFGILPEVQFNFRYDLTKNWRATIGYTAIWLNRVQRSGSAIDTTLNPSQINGGTLAGSPRPAFGNSLFPWQDTSYWAQGMNLGLEFRW
jgi:hypothetical protein